MNPPAVVLIEGLDLAGKSTAWRAVGDRLAARGFAIRRQRNALVAHNELAAQADALRRNPDRDRAETGNLFLAAHRWDSRHFVRPEPGGIHLQDSCWMRTLAHCRFAGERAHAAQLEKEAAAFPTFDRACFLTASLERRRERLLRRQRENPAANDAGDAWVNTHPADFLRLEQALEATVNEFLPAVKIDTTDLSVDEVAERVVAAILDP